MKFKNLILATLLLMLAFTISACGSSGGGGNGGGGGEKTVEYMPSFGFNNGSGGSGSIAASMINTAIKVDEEPPTPDVNDPGFPEAMYKQGKYRFIMFSPFLVGFNKESKTLKNGDVIEKDGLKITVSISGDDVKLAGVVANSGGYINVTLNTVNRTFSYEQRLNFEIGSSQKAIVYVKVDNVQLDDNGFYQTNKGKVYVAPYGSKNLSLFVGKMEYRSAIGNDKFSPCYGDRIVGVYGYMRVPIDGHAAPANILDYTDAQFLALFSDCDGSNWSDSTEHGSGMVICYNKTKDIFYGNSFGKDADKITDLDTKLPWTLLPDTFKVPLSH